MEVAVAFIKRGEIARTVLRILAIAESTYYAHIQAKPATSTIHKGRPCTEYSYTRSGQKVSNEQIKEWLLELAEGETYMYGYKLLGQCLREQHHLVINHKKVYRLCKELDILQKQRVVKSKFPRRLPRNRVVTGPNQLWQTDIKYGYIHGLDRFFFVLSIIDVFDRSIVSYHRGKSCEAKHLCDIALQAFKGRMLPGQPLPVIRSDNGPQFIGKVFGSFCETYAIEHERIPPKSPNLNAYIESFHSLMERELMRKQVFETVEDAYAAVDWYMDFYNHRRLHGSLGRRAPIEFHDWAKQITDCSKYHVVL